LINISPLGPYHHGKRCLRQMDHHKCSLHHVLKRNNQNIHLYLDSINLEEKARACHEGPIGLSSNEFVEMMVLVLELGFQHLDGCFVLELFRGVAEGFNQLGYPRHDPIFAMRGTMI
ncbi:LOW QUALITY PROTEIN: DUF247 domain-containing protein, partial [Cephalotus follicularis]